MRFSELDGRRVGIWGLGRETRSLAALIAERLPGARLTTVISEDPADTLEHPGLDRARLIRAQDAPAALAELEVLVRSPGVSIHKPAIAAARSTGLSVTTATGLWLAERHGHRVIAVTGTKGKSTTATVLAHLAAHDRPTELAGNIGRPVLDLLDTPDDTWVVVELSSYQIADLIHGPEVAVLTNLYREHIDWHGSEATYRAEKLRLFGLPGVRACAYPPGDPEVEAAVRRVPAHVPFGAPGGWHVTADGRAIAAEAETPGAAEPIAIAELPLRGVHNALNVCAALAGLQAAGLPLPALPEALRGIEALPHRLETVVTCDGVEWVDDSISTTPESSLAALAAYPDRAVVLIAGGSDREQAYAPLGAALAARRDATLITLPLTGERIAAAARGAGLAGDRIHAADDMAAAVALARSAARSGTVVLLSPAAPSYHSYRNFEERGAHFAALAIGAQPRRPARPAPGPDAPRDAIDGRAP